jgi:hypothetical protein
MHEAVSHDQVGIAENDSAVRAALYKKLSAVMGQVAYVKKDARNDFHGYNYASEAAIKGALHRSFVENGIIFLMAILDVQEREAAPTKSGKPQWITRVVTEYEFTDADTGYSITKTFAGQGIDGEDKGLPKAITAALKYALTSTFLIETGDDPEAETDQGQRVNAARLRSIERVAAKVGEGSKGYDKKKAVESIEREIERLKGLAGEAKAGKIMGPLLASMRWGIDWPNDPMLDDQQAARDLFKAIAAAVLEAGDEQSDANPDPAKRKSEPKPRQQTGKFAYLDKFQDLKAQHGEAEYYRVLTALGYEKSNQIPVDKRAEVLASMREELQPVERSAPME